MWLKCSLFSKNCFFFSLPAIFFELPITRFDFPLRFEGWIFLCPVSHNAWWVSRTIHPPLPPAQGGLGIPDLKTEAPHYNAASKLPSTACSSFLYAQHVHATGWANFGRPETTTAVAKDNSGEYEKRGCWCISTTGLAMVDNAGKRQGCKLVAQHSTPWGAGADIE